MKWLNIKLVFILLCTYEIHGFSLNVSVFYESLCPDCIRFISNQLYPTYKIFGTEVNLDLVPFGKATVSNESGTVNVTCQHGPEECYGNTIHSCAVALYSIEESAEFVYCSMSSNDPASDHDLEKCANSTGISWTSLDICCKSGQGEKLLLQNGVRTESVRPRVRQIGVPTVIFDGHFNQAYQDKAVVDFKQIVCELLKYKPESCLKFFNSHVVLQMV